MSWASHQNVKNGDLTGTLSFKLKMMKNFRPYRKVPRHLWAPVWNKEWNGKTAFEYCSLLSCHRGANGIRTHASEDKMGVTCLNYPWTTAALCCSNSPDLNENKLKKNPTTVLCRILIWGTNYIKYHSNLTDLSALHSWKSTWLYSLFHLMLEIKKYIYLLYSLMGPF